jgi:hypothetical protein
MVADGLAVDPVLQCLLSYVPASVDPMKPILESIAFILLFVLILALVAIS